MIEKSILYFVLGFLALGWAVDHHFLRRSYDATWREYAFYKSQAESWKAKFDLIDPIRWEVEGNESERAADVCLGYADRMNAKDLRRVSNAFQKLWKEHDATDEPET